MPSPLLAGFVGCYDRAVWTCSSVHSVPALVFSFSSFNFAIIEPSGLYEIKTD